MLTDKERENLANGKHSWKVFLLAFSFLIALSPFFLYHFYRNAERKAIRQDRSFTVGTISRLAYQNRKTRNWYATYATYQVGGVKFMCQGKAFDTLTAEQQKSLIGRQLPVIYEKSNPSNGELLSSERKFSRFNLVLPDSLTWTKSYFFD